MVKVHKYHLPPTPLMPNSPRPLLHYPGLLLPTEPTESTSTTTTIDPAPLHALLQSNNWRTQWIFRYGRTQASHYHSRAHECMAVLTGQATIRFGVADSEHDDEQHGEPRSESPAIFLSARPGDVFVLPAGTAHKTFDAAPAASFALLTPGDGHGVEAGEAGGDVGAALKRVKLEGFTMLGAYPEDAGTEWDFREGGEDVGGFEKVWGVPKPERDPVLGLSEEGVVGVW